MARLVASFGLTQGAMWLRSKPQLTAAGMRGNRDILHTAVR